jgi:hypothetical protein
MLLWIVLGLLFNTRKVQRFFLFTFDRSCYVILTGTNDGRWCRETESMLTGWRGHVIVDAQNRPKVVRRNPCQLLVPAGGAQRETERTASDWSWLAHVGTWQWMRRTVLNSDAFVCADDFSLCSAHKTGIVWVGRGTSYKRKSYLTEYLWLNCFCFW